MTTAKNEVKVREISVDVLFLSLEETRKSIDQAALAELAKSIEKDGVIEALLVRPIDLDCMSGDALPGPAKANDAYEIVAGQRRWLASKLAGKKTCPCIVSAMSDDEAALKRVISNLQRKDLEPMEEAEAYGKLLDRPGATIESVAAAVAKSPSYVGRRLKLLDAIEPVREAFKCSAIEIGHALELARLSQRQQQDLLEYLNVGYTAPDDNDEDGDNENEVVPEPVPGTCVICSSGDDELADNELTWANPEHTVCSDPDCVSEARRKKIITVMVPTRTTVAELRGRIARTELRVLRDVPFSLDDEIPPIACSACPKRAAGAASLFADVAEDTCTDPECLQKKLQVWVKAKLEEADRAGRELVMLYDGNVQNKAGVSRWDCVVGAGCPGAETAIWVSGASIGHFIQICRDKKCLQHGAEAKAGASDSGSKGGVARPATQKMTAEEKRRVAAQKAERAKLLKKVETERAYRERLWKEIVAAEVPDSAEAEIVRRACAQVAAQGGGLVALALGMSADVFDYGKRSEAVNRVAAMAYKDVLRAASLTLVVSDIGVSEYTVLQGQKPKAMEVLAVLFGLDVAAIRAGKPSAKKSTAAPTKPSAKKAPAKVVKKAAAPAKKAAKKTAKKAAKKGGRK